MSRLREELMFRMASFLAWCLISVLGLTARRKVIGYEHVQELVKSGHGFIMAIWHGRTMLPIHYCRGMGIWAITSLSKDGELQTRIVSRFGYRIIRGSTGRGAIKAALSACKKLEEGGILAITPDGPKGPPNQVQQGIVFMAQRAGCPIVPIGVGVRTRKLMPAWDKYVIPFPFGKSAIIFGEPMYMPGDGNSDPPPEMLLKNALDDLQRQAERMVGEGC